MAAEKYDHCRFLKAMVLFYRLNISDMRDEIGFIDTPEARRLKDCFEQIDRKMLDITDHIKGHINGKNC